MSAAGCHCFDLLCAVDSWCAAHHRVSFPEPGCKGIKPPCIMCVQYRGGCSVPWGVFSTVGDIMSTMGGYLEYRGGFQYRGGYHDKCGGYL